MESVYYCMDDHSMKFINQTVDSLGMRKNMCTISDKFLVISKCCRQELQDRRGKKGFGKTKSTATSRVP